ncbi:MAG TPA: hypothetical protein VGN32_08785, partial [Ktedonobacterales bacterium]|nr:hypothetical protein [Ktedonobacterales bacterium]
MHNTNHTTAAPERDQEAQRADSHREPLVLTLGHLYPDQLNIYGDRGNIITLRQRCAWRGITLRVVAMGLGDVLDPDAYDLLFIG